MTIAMDIATPPVLPEEEREAYWERCTSGDAFATAERKKYVPEPRVLWQHGEFRIVESWRGSCPSIMKDTCWSIGSCWYIEKCRGCDEMGGAQWDAIGADDSGDALWAVIRLLRETKRVGWDEAVTSTA